MFAFDADCSDCRSSDPNNKFNGKVYCKKHREYVSANQDICRDAAEVMGRPTCDRNDMRRYSKEHGYYIVTAVTEILGLDSGNRYLLAFRNLRYLVASKYLRDEVSPSDDRYQEFFREYDEIGPELANKLREEPRSFEYAEYLRVCFLEKFVIEFLIGKIDDAFATYSQMFEVIKKRYGISQEDKEQKNLVCKG